MDPDHGPVDTPYRSSPINLWPLFAMARGWNVNGAGTWQWGHAQRPFRLHTRYVLKIPVERASCRSHTTLALSRTRTGAELCLARDFRDLRRGRRVKVSVLPVYMGSVHTVPSSGAC